MGRVPRTTFAHALKSARKAAGLSQAELARRSGLTGSYISVLESRRRRPPSPKVIRALCQALDIPDGPLQDAAALERSPVAVRRRLERLRRERGKERKSGDRLLTTTLFHLSRRPRVIDPLSHFMGLPEGQQAVLAGLLGRLRTTRTLEEAEAKTEEVLADTPEEERDALVRALPEVLAAAPPARKGSGMPVAPPVPLARIPVLEDPDAPERVLETMVLDPRFAEGRTFLWRVTTSDAHPKVERDDWVLCRSDLDAEDGDLVLFHHEGRWRLGLHHAQGDAVRIDFPRPEVPPLRIKEEAFGAAGVVRLVLRTLS